MSERRFLHDAARTPSKAATANGGEAAVFVPVCAFPLDAFSEIRCVDDDHARPWP